MPRITIESVDQVEDQSARSSESFDRIAFAERAVALVRPPRTTVAICEGARRVRLETGRQWGATRADARWAVLSVPHDASRQAIASAVLGLYGGGEAKAFTLDLLMAGTTHETP